MTMQLARTGLQEEIDRSRAVTRTDHYSMSIGEWTSLYEKYEIDIHPEYQVFFRWSPNQKSRLIESILLGIPIPPIFVSQREDGVWEVVDGLQRLSTILQFAGILRDGEREVLPPLALERTKYLPSLEGKKWNDPEDPENSLTATQRLIIKRSKIDASIILSESDEVSKYELFLRLNTGGSPLSAQEVRNSVLLMANKEMYSHIRSMSRDPNFLDCAALTDRALDEQYDMELVLRFVILRTLDEMELSRIGDIGDFLTERMTEIAQQRGFDFEEEHRAFATTFGLLKHSMGSDSFRNYDSNQGKFTGGFLVSRFEIVALGLGYNYKEATRANLDIKSIIEGNSQMEQSTSKPGFRAASRLPETISLGRMIFNP